MIMIPMIFEDICNGVYFRINTEHILFQEM